jgi:hypothetical protein
MSVPSPALDNHNYVRDLEKKRQWASAPKVLRFTFSYGDARVADGARKTALNVQNVTEPLRCPAASMSC